MDRLAVMAPMARSSAVRADQYTREELAHYEAIVQRYARHVYNIAYRMAGNEADARDLVQEAFLRVYRALRRVEPDAPLERWLYRIVSNLHIDLLRKRPRTRIESLDAPVETARGEVSREIADLESRDRKSTRLNSSHSSISYAVFCLKKKKKIIMC